MNKLSDNFIVGFISGLIVPIIAFSIYATINFPDSSIIEALLFYKKGNVLTHVISLSVLANLLPFFAFLNNIDISIEREKPWELFTKCASAIPADNSHEVNK